MFRIAICDDEEYFRLREKELIREYMGEKRCACQIDLYTSGKEMLSKADVILQYDVVFLDVTMEEMDGMETARRIRQMSGDIYIVFVTAYITYVLEGYKVGAVRYLLKEEDSLQNALKECLHTITDRMSHGEVMCTFEFPDGKKSIPADSILYVESRLHKVIFFVMEDEVKEYSRYEKLDRVEQELGKYGFCRSHQSFLVNMKYARGVERYKISLENGMTVNISKKYYKRVETEYIRCQGEM